MPSNKPHRIAYAHPGGDYTLCVTEEATGNLVLSYSGGTLEIAEGIFGPVNVLAPHLQTSFCLELPNVIPGKAKSRFFTFTAEKVQEVIATVLRAQAA